MINPDFFFPHHLSRGMIAGLANGESQGKRIRVCVGEERSGGSRDEELTQNFGICGWSRRREPRTSEKLPWDNQGAKRGNTCGTSRVRSSTFA